MRRMAVLFHRRWLVATFFATVAVLGATHIPQEMMPRDLQVRMLDKIEHTAAYGALSLLLLMSFRRPPGLKAMGAILLVGMLVGAVDEATQPLVNRVGSPGDWAADVVGVGIACLLFLVIRFYLRRSRSPSGLRSALQT